MARAVAYLRLTLAWSGAGCTDCQDGMATEVGRRARDWDVRCWQSACGLFLTLSARPSRGEELG